MRKLAQAKHPTKRSAKGKEPTVATAPELDQSPVGQLSGLSLSDQSDRNETRGRFVNASAFLHEVLERLKTEGGESPQFPELQGEPDQFDRRFRDKLNKVLEDRRAVLKDKTLCSKPAEILLGVFTVLSPFAKHFLSVAIQAQQVRLQAAG
jgi:hypothetical protein